MEYNSQRDKLLMPEYGRHVQNMLMHAKGIENKEERQAFVEIVVKLMEQMQTGAKPSRELSEKLWNHVFMITNYELDVDAPDDIHIVKHSEQPKPGKLEYPTKNMRYRHYGHNVQKLIAKAKDMDDEAKQELFANAIGSYMKLAYKTWNGEHFVSDETIKGDLKSMSDGEIDLDESVSLDFLNHHHHSSGRSAKKRRNGSSGGRHRSKGQRSKRKR